MGCIGRLLFGFFASLLTVIVLAVAALLVGFRALPGWIEREVSARSDFSLTMASAEANLLQGSALLREVAIRNPADYPSDHFLILRAFGIDVAPASVFGERMVIDSLLIDVETLALVSPSGDKARNLESLVTALVGPEGLVRPGAEGGEGGERSGPRYVIREVEVRMDRLELVGADGQVRMFDTGIDLRMEGVTDLNKVAAELSRALAAVDAGIPADLLGGVNWDRLGEVPGLFMSLRELPGQILENVFEKSRG